jgi:short-subunit dehydrogenase
MTTDLRDKSVVVTGAAAGVGRAVALQLAHEGARLGLISRDRAALEALAEEIRGQGGQASIAAIDVSNPNDVFDAADRFAREFGGIDVWVNDAMLTVFSLVRDIPAEEYRRVTDVTYHGFVYGTMAALRHMRARNAGRIVNVGSALAYRGIPLQSAYCGAKHAIRGFTASLRSELKHENSAITVSLVELPAMNTPQFDWARTHRAHEPRPMGAIYQPEAAARAIVRAARTGAREYWVGASTFMTIVGNMVAPKILDWRLGRTAVAGQETQKLIAPQRPDNLFAPVAPLHRTRGSFGDAKPDALILDGDLARVAVIAAGAVLFFALGRLAGPRRAH